MYKKEITPDNTTYSTLSFTYNFAGSVLTDQDGRSNTTTFTYDDLGRLITQKDALNNQTTYTYNSLDKVMTRTEPGNRITANTYDVLQRLTSEKVYLSGSNDNVYKNYTYDASGNMLTMVQGSYVSGVYTNGLQKTYAYNNMNRVTDEYTQIDATRSEHIVSTYDANGNKTSDTDNANATGAKYIKHSYTYDYAKRIATEEGIAADNGMKRGYYSKSYLRDYAGNLTSETDYVGNDSNGAPTYKTATFTYDFRNRVSTKSYPLGTGLTRNTAYTYDKKGNLTSETTNVSGVACTTAYEYDGLGKTIRKTDATGNTTRYLYDAAGNKTKDIDPQVYSNVQYLV